MNSLPVTGGRPRWFLELLAFAAIYFLWGGTFLAIRIAVLEIPPFFKAGMRFFAAGVLLYLGMRLKGMAKPSFAQWRSLSGTAFLMFVVTYGALFWASQYVTSSMTAVIEATLPITTVTLEIFVLHTQPFRWRIVGAVAVGFSGVLLLLLHNPGQQLAVIPCLAILGAGIAWSIGTVLTKRWSLPASRPLCAGAQMMIGGAVLLVLSSVLGEMHPFPRISLRAGLALFYLTVCGSLIAYTAYVWLLARFSATHVSSHAYVNPLVAVALGHFMVGEPLTARSVLASMIIVFSILLILSREAERRTGVRPDLAANYQRTALRGLKLRWRRRACQMPGKLASFDKSGRETRIEDPEPLI